MHRPLLAAGLLLIAASFAVPLAAQVEPGFRFERIEVRNAKRVSTDIVLAESRLNTNRVYSEVELREAADRLMRAPYLLDAQFSLEKGSVRDAYVLVITVTETKPFFYRADLTHYMTSDEQLRVESDSGAVVGMRFFVGRKGAFHFGVDSTRRDIDRLERNEHSAVEVGYTRYDIFGSRAFVTLNLQHTLPGISGESSRTLPEIVAGVPLTPNQTLSGRYTATDITREAGGSVKPFPETREAQRILQVRWAYDTTNHPFVPTRGSLFSVAPTLIDTDEVLVGSATPRDAYPVHSRATGVTGSAGRYWELSERNSVSAALEGGWLSRHYHDLRPLSGREPRDHFATLNLGFSHSLWDAARREVGGDSRIEVNFRTSDDESRFRADRFGETVDRLNVAWAFRNAWGSVRLGVGYAW